MSNKNKGIDFSEQGGVIILPSTQRIHANLYNPMPIKNQGSFSNNDNFIVNSKKGLKKSPLKKLLAATSASQTLLK